MKGCNDGHLDIDLDGRESAVIHLPDELSGMDGDIGDRTILGLVGDGPRHFGHVLGNAPDHFAFELFHNLRTPLPSPSFGSGYLVAILGNE